LRLALVLGASAALLLQACAGSMPVRHPYDRSCGCWKAPGSKGASSATASIPVPPGTSATGQASFYGDEFDGKPTASGETFSSDGRTCAHREYPFGTKLKVTSLKTGKSTEVRVNDRGPHVAGRILDLSHGAAKDIGLDVEGVGEVAIEVLP
jgi:rare lipoprotein A